MIYNTRNRSNDTTKSQKEKGPVLMLMQVKIEVKLDCPICSEQKNKMWSLKSLVMLECEGRTGLHMQYNTSDSQALY